MKQHFKLTLTIALLAVGTFFPWADGAQAQSSLDLLLGRKPKVKDYNQPPDKNEFQLPTNGEYKASPTFFSARSDSERCNAIDLWLSSIRHEVRYDKQFKNYRWVNNEVDMSMVPKVYIPRFASADFRNIFGKGLPELSEKETKKIGKALKDCSYQKWVSGLEWDFTYSRLGDWASEFASYEARAKENRLELLKERYRADHKAEARRLGYPLAEVLSEGNNYRLHAAFLNDGAVDWCSPSARQAIVVLLLKGNEKLRIQNDELYWTRFESEILPAAKKSCPGADTVYALNYIDGFYIDYGRNQIALRPSPVKASDVHSIAVYAVNDNKKYSWINGESLSNLTTAARRVTFRNSPDGVAAASIEDLRELLRLRREKKEAEERKRALEDIARMEEQQRQAEIQKQQKIAKTREAQLPKATGLLKFYKKGAAESYDFKDFKSRDILQNIYSGNFEPFTGGYESLDEVTSQVGDTFRTADPRNPFAFLGNLINNSVQLNDFNERRKTINTVFYAYHNVYKDVCSVSKEMSWRASEPWVFYMTRNDVRVEGSERVGISILVREPFLSAYNRVYGSLGSTANVSPAIPQAYVSDFQALLRSEGCSSAAVRHFETNLYLATEWLMPVQLLLKP